MIDHGADHLAIHCQFLLRSANPGREPAALCTHPAREGRDCVGPFLHDLATECGLWERHPDSHLIAAPVPERWQGRRRRAGFDMQRGWR